MIWMRTRPLAQHETNPSPAVSDTNMPRMNRAKLSLSPNTCHARKQSRLSVLPAATRLAHAQLERPEGMATARAASRRLAAGDGPRPTPAVGPASGGRTQFNLSSSAATAVVFVSILLCFILLCTYCRCARQRAIAGARRRVMRELVPGAALFLRPSAAALPPVVPYAEAAKKGLPEDCPICLEPFCDGDGVRVVPACGHLYHAPCIDRWLDMRNSCPVCRCTVASLYDAGRARDPAAVAVRDGGEDGDDDDDQEAVLQRVVAMIEAIREEQREEEEAAAAARRAAGGDGGS